MVRARRFCRVCKHTHGHLPCGTVRWVLRGQYWRPIICWCDGTTPHTEEQEGPP